MKDLLGNFYRNKSFCFLLQIGKISILVAIGLGSIAAVYLVTAVDEVSSETLLDTNQTIIGQPISYPSGSPQISSKIVTIPAGAETGPHIHEYPMFAYIMSGEITVDYGEKGLKTYLQGDSIIEAVNYTHNGINNGNKSAEILVVLIGEG